MDDEGLALLTALRTRYDGRRRNSYNEIECGDHYAGGMAGWSVLEALTRARYDGLRGNLRLGARVERYPLFAGIGRGEVTVDGGRISFQCLGGEVAVRTVEVVDGTVGSVRVGDTELEAETSTAVTAQHGETLTVDMPGCQTLVSKAHTNPTIAASRPRTRVRHGGFRAAFNQCLSARPLLRRGSTRRVSTGHQPGPRARSETSSREIRACGSQRRRPPSSRASPPRPSTENRRAPSSRDRRSSR